MQLLNFSTPANGSSRLTIDHWPLGQVSWVLLGRNDSGKDYLFKALTGAMPYSGQLTWAGLKPVISCVSFDEQKALVEREIQQDESDLLDEIDPGTSVIEILEEVESDTRLCHAIAQQFGLINLLEQGFRSLSTGETRKLLLARALLKKPDVLLLEDPFDGLDPVAKQVISQTLESLCKQGIQILMILDRPMDRPDWIDHVAIFEQGHLALTGTIKQVQSSSCWQDLTQIDCTIKPPSPLQSHQPLAPHEPIIELRHIKVNYGAKQVFSDLNWCIQQGEHWRIIGPNGCGKSTLLKLICGDHPQCYSNWIRQFGMQRGQGESIWDIKKHIGLVSSEFHLNYRAQVNTITVVVSGFFDSIGVYKEVSDYQTLHALAWLNWFQLGHFANQPFSTLNYGQQRLVLIVRALVKSPHLLILDEPLQGLDDTAAQRVLAAINQIIEAGVSQLLYVSHRDEPGLHARCKILNLSRNT